MSLMMKKKRLTRGIVYSASVADFQIGMPNHALHGLGRKSNYARLSDYAPDLAWETTPYHPHNVVFEQWTSVANYPSQDFYRYFILIELQNYMLINMI